MEIRVTGDAALSKGEASNLVFKLMGEWMQPLLSNPEYLKFKKKGLLYTLFFDDEDEPEIGPLEVSPVNPEAEHDALLSYLHLRTAVQDTGYYQYYYRRYRFQGLPVTKTDYFRITCEHYISSFYVIKQRLKDYLNRMKLLKVISSDDVTTYLSIYDKQFSWELSQRNIVHHHRYFDNAEVSRLSMLEVFSSGISDKLTWFAKRKHAQDFRKAMKVWSVKAKARAAALEQWDELATRIMINPRSFIHTPKQVVNV